MRQLGLITFSAALACSVTGAVAACGTGSTGGGIRTGTTGHASGGVSTAHAGGVSGGCHVTAHSAAAVAQPALFKSQVATIPEHRTVKKAAVQHASAPAVARPAVLRTHRG